MDVARLNFSHSSHADHAQQHRAASRRRDQTREAHRHPCRPARPEDPHRRRSPAARPYAVRPGQRFVITTARVLGDATRVSTTFRPLPREVHRGDRILLSDGLIELRVETSARPGSHLRSRQRRRARRAQRHQSSGNSASRSRAHAKRPRRTWPLRSSRMSTTSPSASCAIPRTSCWRRL